MFTQAWFWLLMAAVVLINPLINAHGSKNTPNAIGGFCALSCVVFCVIGLFKAEHWWYPIIGLIASLLVSGFIGGITKGAEKLNLILVMIGMVACPALCLIMYIISY